MKPHKNVHIYIRKKQPAQARKCLYCGKAFKTTNKRREYCVTSHAKYASAARIAEQARAFREQRLRESQSKLGRSANSGSATRGVK